MQSDRLQDKKWRPHVKTNMEDEAKYKCIHMNSWEDELFDFYVVDDKVKLGEDQSIKDLDALSCSESADSADTRLPKIEVALNDDIHLTPKQEDKMECWFSGDQCVDYDIAKFLASEQCGRASNDLKSHWLEAEKIRPWWQTAGKDELASLVAQKSLDHIENCDLPRPRINHTRKTLSSSSNQKAGTEIGGITTSGCSLQDLELPFSPCQSTDSDTSNKNNQTKSDNNTKAELLKALCHSQTRAREAEKAAQQAYKDKEHILSLFFRQASQLFAYKQWLHILQLENLCLQLRMLNNSPLLNLFPVTIPPVSGKVKQLKKRKRSNKRCGIIGKCAVAFAVGLGLAGAGLFLGWTMTWVFPSI